jgi:hypothetical protein
VSDDFFSVGNEPAIAEAGLMKEQLQAIELLMDLKNKEKIMEKCYANRPVKRYSVVPGHHSAKKEQAPAPVEAQVEQGPAEQGPAEQGPAEQGGGKKHRHKHSKRCRHSKHKSHKHRHSKHRHRHRHSKRCKH